MILATWCGVLFLYGIARGPLYRTEALRAIIGRECLHGHWLYPVLYGEPFLTKPPGHYVAIGLCSWPWGEVTVATARLPSVVAATVTVVLMSCLFRRAVGDAAALLVGLLLPASVLWLEKVPSAEIDMTLVGWVTAALAAAWAAVGRNDSPERPSPTGRPLMWFVALLCVAGGTLTKWTAPAFFYLTVVPWLAWQGKLRMLVGWWHLAAVALAVAVGAGWATAVAQQVGWDLLLETVRAEAAYRFSPGRAPAGIPMVDRFLYPVTVLAAHLPVSAFALLTLRPGFLTQWDDRSRALLQLLHCWTWPNLLFWSLVPHHNVRYALPLGPGLVGLGVMGLVGTVRSAAVVRIGVAGFLALWLVVKVVFVEVVVPARGARRNPEPAAARLRDTVPAGEPLYLFRLKDEGVLFAYGRPAVRLYDPRALPRGAYVVLTRTEWDNRARFGPLHLVHWMHDQQGDPLILARSP